MGDVKRRYHSPRRERQAQETRERITESARGLFVREGFAKATVGAIAREAGVSEQTVYASVGSKRGILLALIERLEAEGGSAELRQELRSLEDPRRQLRAFVRFSRRFFERGQDVIGIALAARSDPEVESFWREGETRRREGEARLVRSWAEGGALRPGLDEGEAADVMWALTGPDLYTLFVVGCGWSPSRFEEWLFYTLQSQLFGGAVPDTP